MLGTLRIISKIYKDPLVELSTKKQLFQMQRNKEIEKLNLNLGAKRVRWVYGRPRGCHWQKKQKRCQNRDFATLGRRVSAGEVRLPKNNRCFFMRTMAQIIKFRSSCSLFKFSMTYFLCICFVYLLTFVTPLFALTLVCSLRARISWSRWSLKVIERFCLFLLLELMRCCC